MFFDSVTILAFTVIIPLIVGILCFKRMPATFRPIVYLLGAWTIAEVYMYILRLHHTYNMHVSYILTILEVFILSLFYYKATNDSRIKRLSFVGVVLVAIEWLAFRTEMNTYSLSVEYIIVICLALYLCYEIASNRASDAFLIINITLLFYFLSSFPYFFAWEWLRISNIKLLTLLASIHLNVHALCYLVIAYALWKSAYSYSAR